MPANRLLGCWAEIQRLGDYSDEEVFEMLKAHKSKPGEDIGLELYPNHLGYSTKQEALEAFNNPSTTQTDEPTN